MEALLHSFAYGEHVEARRSLGYRLLTPAEAWDWSAEVDGLAHRLQATPYPDHWPPTELFCSVLLADGSRLIAMARYGLVDHTPGQRRGGLELIGVVAPGSLGVASALAVYRWLRPRRATVDDLRALGGTMHLADILSQVPPSSAAAESAPVLPVKVWQDGVLLFAAAAPTDPDRRLGLLERGDAANWQWLPLVGADFPLATYAARGPLVAWTPHLADVAVKVGPGTPPSKSTRPAPLLLSLLIGLLLLTVANLWATLARRPIAAPVAPASQSSTEKEADVSAERFARALVRVMDRHGGNGKIGQKAAAAEFERLAAQDPDLKLGGPQAAELVVALHGMSRYNPAQVEDAIRHALKDKGYDPLLVDLICRRVQEQLSAGTGD
jgi:hypothetical protein